MKAEVEELSGPGARGGSDCGCGNGPHCEVNQKESGSRKIQALQMDALNGTGDNWEVLNRNGDQYVLL